MFGLLQFKNAIFKILFSTAQHAGIAVHNHPPGGRHISTEIWLRLSSLFPFSRAFSVFPVFFRLSRFFFRLSRFFSAFTFFPPLPFFRLSLFSAFPSFPRFFKKQKPLRRRESQTHHTCLSMGKFKRLEYFDAALQRTLEATVMKTYTESLNAMDLSIYTEHPVKDWKSVFCMEHQEALKQEILKIL